MGYDRYGWDDSCFAPVLLAALAAITAFFGVLKVWGGKK